MIPTMVAFLSIQNEVRSVDLQNLTAYVAEVGDGRRQEVEDVFTDASRELQNFAESDNYRPLNLSMMSGNATETTIRDVNAYINGELIPTGLFNQIRLLDATGEVVGVSSTLTEEGIRIPHVPLGTDQSGLVSFQSGLTSVALGNVQRLIVDEIDGELVAEIVHVLYSNRFPVGYVVGRINYDTAILSLFKERDAFVQTHSYLVTGGDQIITTEDYVETANTSQNVAPVDAAFSLNSGTDVYMVGDQETIGYYSPVKDTPFVIITEADANTSFTLTLINLSERLGVILVFAALLALGLGLLFNLTITPALHLLRSDIRALDGGDFRRPVEVAGRGDEIGLVARTFLNTREQILNNIQDLEARIANSARDIQATQEISRVAATQLDLQVLMDGVVELIVQAFPSIYHAQIFLIDDERLFAVLRASTGEPGKQLLSRGHRLEVGGVSVIGRVSEEGRVVLARDTAESDFHRRNEFLIDTAAELALPLRVGETIIGALDVQSKQSDSFDENLTRTLETMAAQVAVAITNARLYQESVRRLEEIEIANRETTYHSWQEHMNFRRESALMREAGSHTDTDASGLRQEAVTQQQAAIGERTDHNTIPFAVPIQLRGQILGAVEWELPVGEFSEQKVQLAQNLVNRLAVSLDNARLFQESQRAINRERLVNDIAAKLTGQTDIDGILQTAVREVGQALRAPQVNIQLLWEESNGS